MRLTCNLQKSACNQNLFTSRLTPSRSNFSMRIMLSVILLGVLLISPILANDFGSNYLVCKSMKDVFDVDFERNHTQRSASIRGKPGKRGPPGPEGPPGPIGPMGKVNYERIDESLEEKLLSIKRKLQCHNGVAIGTNCYVLPYVAGERRNFQRAHSTCIFHGWNLAEIQNESDYSAIYQYVQRTWSVDVTLPSSTQVQVWLSMLFRGGHVIHNDGKVATFVKWFPGYPRSTSGHDHMAFEVAIKPEHSKTSNGMFNITPSHVAIPLCVFTLD